MKKSVVYLRVCLTLSKCLWHKQTFFGGLDWPRPSIRVLHAQWLKITKKVAFSLLIQPNFTQPNLALPILTQPYLT